MADPLLHIDNLRVSFKRGGEVVHGIEIVVPRRRRVGVIGESGSGKSVTALSVLRLHDERTMTYGSDSAIKFDGKDLLRASTRELNAVRGAKISMIFQDPMNTLNPVFRVGPAIVDVLRTHDKSLSAGEAERRTKAALDSVGIRNVDVVFQQYPHQLSGGMRQRVMIAMATAARPDLLIADEPTSALDVTVQAAVLDTLDALAQERDLAVLMITHDMGVVARFCDDVYVMYHGDVVEYGPTAQVLNDPRHEYTQRLLSAVPRLHP